MTIDSDRCGDTLGVTMASNRPSTVIANHTGRLILTTDNPHASPDDDLLIEAMGIADFIGARLDERADSLRLPSATFGFARGESRLMPSNVGAMASRLGHAFCVGPCFLSLVSFTGCAVQIETSPDPHTPFCHIRLPPLSPHPRLHCGRNTRPPRCANCRGRLADWRKRTVHWASHPDQGVTCPSCGKIRPPWQWDWKEQAGFGRRVIFVEEVFPGEATPTQSLLDLLADASGTGWRHFYVRD